MKKVIVIAHGGTQVGMGHIMRSMTLANKLRQTGCLVSYISKYEIGQKLLKENGYQVSEISTHNRSGKEFSYGAISEITSEIHHVRSILEKLHPDLVVLDSYEVNKDYFSMLKRSGSYIVYIDDLNAFDYEADCVINGGLNALQLSYPKTNPGKRYLLGLSYNLLREEFILPTLQKAGRSPKRILITTGAADPHNVTDKILSHLSNSPMFSQFEVKAVLGTGFLTENKIHLRNKYQSYSNVEFLDSPKKMSEWMIWSDIGICAGGSTIYEFFACQVLTLAFIYAQNQKDNVELAQREGLLFSLGTYEQMTQASLLGCIEQLLSNTELRQRILKNMRECVDGKGAERIVKQII